MTEPTKIVIQRNAGPLPRRHVGPRMKRNWPFAKLNVGDAFTVPFGADEPQHLQRQLSAAGRVYSRNHNEHAKFSTRMTDNGVKVWRIK